MAFNKTDLVYSDYSWTVYSGDNPKIKGEPDSTLFSRKEGYELLYLINKLTDSIIVGKKIEKLIHEDLPSNIRSQKDVKEWINLKLK